MLEHTFSGSSEVLAHPFFLKKATSSGVSESTPYGIVRLFCSSVGETRGREYPNRDALASFRQRLF